MKKVIWKVTQSWPGLMKIDKWYVDDFSVLAVLKLRVGDKLVVSTRKTVGSKPVKISIGNFDAKIMYGRRKCDIACKPELREFLKLADSENFPELVYVTVIRTKKVKKARS